MSSNAELISRTALQWCTAGLPQTNPPARLLLGAPEKPRARPIDNRPSRPAGTMLPCAPVSDAEPGRGHRIDGDSARVGPSGLSHTWSFLPRGLFPSVRATCRLSSRRCRQGPGSHPTLQLRVGGGRERGARVGGGENAVAAVARPSMRSERVTERPDRRGVSVARGAPRRAACSVARGGVAVPGARGRTRLAAPPQARLTGDGPGSVIPASPGARPPSARGLRSLRFLRMTAGSTGSRRRFAPRDDRKSTGSRRRSVPRAMTGFRDDNRGGYRTVRRTWRR